MKNIGKTRVFLHISVVVENSFSQNSRKMSKRNLVIKPSNIHRQKMLYPDLCRIFTLNSATLSVLSIHGLFDELLMISHFVIFYISLNDGRTTTDDDDDDGRRTTTDGFSISAVYPSKFGRTETFFFLSRNPLDEIYLPRWFPSL